ncbi:MAG TPA: hypothetical protein VIM65_23050 [Cyclobacteriaceae bacterium]
MMKLPSNTELTLQLIQEELKCRKFFNSLSKLGLRDSHYQPNLDNLIMAYVGLYDNTDQTFEFYYDIIETHSERIDETSESVIEQALKVYIALLAEVKRREEV